MDIYLALAIALVASSIGFFAGHFAGYSRAADLYTRPRYRRVGK